MLRGLVRLSAVAAALALLQGCGAAERLPITDVSDLSGRRIGVCLAWAPDYPRSFEDGETGEAMGFDSLLRELFKNETFREEFLKKLASKVKFIGNIAVIRAQ